MNDDYEQAVVSCLLNNPKNKKFVSVLKGEYFSNESFARIYDCIDEKDTFPKIVKKLEGEISFRDLLNLQDLVKLPTLDNLLGYARLVLYAYKQRAIKLIDDKDFEKTEKLVKELDSLQIDIPDNRENVSEAFLMDLERMYRGEEDTSTIATGFTSLDSAIRGFRKSELIIVGGRPAMGKTTIGTDIAYNMAKSGKKVVFYSLEMAEKELHTRLVKKATGIENLYKITQEQFEQCITASRMISDSSLKIYDNAGVTVEDIYLQSRQIKDSTGLDVVVIDHLSILKSANYFKNRYEEISDITRQLKVMAKDLNVVVITLCQLNRGLEAREVKIPTMADLRDSGSIEQDADLICFIHRPEYYKLQKNEDPEPDEIGRALLSVCKNRRGSVGCINLRFNKNIPEFGE